MAVADSTIFIALTILLALFSYKELSKFLGSLAIFLCGVGIMYAEPTHAWTGLIIFAIGFLMIVYQLMSRKKRKRA